ncbi:MAG: GNAT family N-acetyltransferase [Gemmatimonadales bacterium]
MPPLDGLVGPLRLEPTHIDELNRLFSDAFTDRYHRDGMTGVRVPQLSPAIWRYAIEAAGEGALHWRDRAGGLVAFNLVHRSGTEGWMGPLAVRTDQQHRGVGRAIVREGVELLERRGCRTIGLETMPRTVDNIGFYSRLGFRPGHLTVSMVRDVGRGDGAAAEAGSRLEPAGAAVPGARQLTEALVPGLDFTREVDLTMRHSLGDLTVVRDGEWRGFALWHSAPLALGRSAEELRILKVAAVDRAAFRRVIRGALAAAAARGLGRVGIRCQTAFREAYADLIDLGFRVHWTDLRMVLHERPERPPTSGVVFSNWEI